jgi:hypothetical protein
MEEGQLTLECEQDQWAVTPGQSLVLYSGDVCLGGGIIQSSDTPPAVSAGLFGSHAAPDHRTNPSNKQEKSHS